MIMLETERLVIRNFNSGDWKALLEMILQYEASGLAAYDQQWPTSPGEIKGVAEGFASGDSFLAVCLKDSGCFIGLVSLNPEGSEDSHEFNLGYIFNFDYHSKGYASEACRALVGYAYDQLNAEKLITGTAQANRASCRLLERLGFTKITESVGFFRKTPAGEPIEFTGGTYAMTRDEWYRMVIQNSK